MSLLLLLGLLEFRFLKPALKKNAKPKAKNNYFLRSSIELLLLFDLSSIVFLLVLFFKDLTTNIVTLFLLEIFLGVCLSMRATWLSINTKEAVDLEIAEEKGARAELFPSVARTIAKSNNPMATSIPREENPLNTVIRDMNAASIPRVMPPQGFATARSSQVARTKGKKRT